MAKDTSIKIKVVGDTKSFDKHMQNVDKRLDRTAKSSKQTKKEVNDLGKSFTQTANQVAIFNGQLDPVSGRLSAIGTGISRFGVSSIVASAGVATLGLAIIKAINAGDQYEKRQLRFNALLRATSYQSKLTARDLESLANQIGIDTLSSTEEAAEGIQALLTFKNIQGDVFKDTIRLARDAQVAFGGNLREGVVAFGKALNDPIANLGALSRKGIQFTDTQKEMIHTAWEAGDALKAQTIIIQEMRSQFGGLANEEAKTLEGSVDSLSHSWDRLWETIGRTSSMRSVRSGLSDLYGVLADGADTLSEKHKEDAKFLILLEERRNLESRYNEELAEQIALKDELASAEKIVEKVPDYELYQRMVKNAEKALKAQDEIVSRFKSKLIISQKKTDAIIKKGVKYKKDLADQEKKADKIRAKAEEVQLQNRLEQIIKNGNKIIRVNDSRWETDLEKAKRFYDETIKLNNEQSEKEKKIAEKVGYETAEIDERWDAQNLKAKQGYDAKVAEIDRRAAERDKATLLRTERATKVALNAMKKRSAMLSEITSGTGKYAQLETAYVNDVNKLAEAEFTKTEITARGFKTRQELLNFYIGKLTENYEKDVREHTEAEESKTAKTIEQAAKRAAASFKKEVRLDFAQIEGGAGAVQDFFGINLDESANKFKALEDQLATHLEATSEMKISNEEKIARHAEIVKEYGIKQAELEKEGKVQAYGDTWNAINELGGSGSKKAFMIAKAANIAQAIMSTYTAAANAYAQVPFPYNIVASALITAAGLVKVRNIKDQQMPQFHDGISNVPREGSYLLAQGERVVGSQLNADLTADLKRRNNGGDTNTNTATINSYGDASPEAIARAMVRVMGKPNKKLDNAVYGAMNRGRKNGGKRFA